MAGSIKRMNYFDGLFLNADDFIVEQNYHIKMRSIHNQNMHSGGIVKGLDVSAISDSQVKVSCGLAIVLHSSEGRNLWREILVEDDSPGNILDISKYNEGENIYISISYNEVDVDIVKDKGADSKGIHLWEHSVIRHGKDKPAEPFKDIILARVVRNTDKSVSVFYTETNNAPLRVYAGVVSGKASFRVEGKDDNAPYIEGIKDSDGNNALSISAALSKFSGGLHADSGSIDGDLSVNGVMKWGISGTRTELRETFDSIDKTRLQSGFFEITSANNGNWFPKASEKQHLIECRNSNPEQNFAMQFAGSFYDQDFWCRKTNNNNNTHWNKLWHSGNLKPNDMLKKSGDEMTGYLKLNLDPIDAMHAATKKYVDDKVKAVSKYELHIIDEVHKRTMPETYKGVLKAEFKLTSMMDIVEENGRGHFCNVLGLSGTNDDHDGKAHELAFLDNDNIYYRTGTRYHGWGQEWFKLWHSGNLNLEDYHGRLKVNGEIECTNLTCSGIIHGSIKKDGSINSGSGFKVTKIDEGIYEISFDKQFEVSPTIVASPQWPDFTSYSETNSSIGDNAVVIAVNTHMCRIKTGSAYKKKDFDCNFHFIVMGAVE